MKEIIIECEKCNRTLIIIRSEDNKVCCVCPECYETFTLIFEKPRKPNIN